MPAQPERTSSATTPSDQQQPIASKIDTPTSARPANMSRGLSIPRRMCLSTMWTIFGLVFFYLVMVGLSALQKTIVFDRLPHNSWPRTASRHTGAVSVVPLALFMLTDKARKRSLFFAVMTACALFAHFVIITSDLWVYSDDEIMVQMLERERSHVFFGLFGRFGANAWRMTGSIGFVASLVLAMERTYGRGLGSGSGELPIISKAAVGWLVGVNVLALGERLMEAALKGSCEIAEVIYPVYLLVLLAVCGSYGFAERAGVLQEEVDEEKKEQ